MGWLGELEEQNLSAPPSGGGWLAALEDEPMAAPDRIDVGRVLGRVAGGVKRAVRGASLSFPSKPTVPRPLEGVEVDAPPHVAETLRRREEAQAVEAGPYRDAPPLVLPQAPEGPADINDVMREVEKAGVSAATAGLSELVPGAAPNREMLARSKSGEALAGVAGMAASAPLWVLAAAAPEAALARAGVRGVGPRVFSNLLGPYGIGATRGGVEAATQGAPLSRIHEAGVEEMSMAAPFVLGAEAGLGALGGFSRLLRRGKMKPAAPLPEWAASPERETLGARQGAAVDRAAEAEMLDPRKVVEPRRFDWTTPEKVWATPEDVGKPWHRNLPATAEEAGAIEKRGVLVPEERAALTKWFAENGPGKPPPPPDELQRWFEGADRPAPKFSDLLPARRGGKEPQATSAKPIAPEEPFGLERMRFREGEAPMAAPERPRAPLESGPPAAGEFAPAAAPAAKPPSGGTTLSMLGTGTATPPQVRRAISAAGATLSAEWPAAMQSVRQRMLMGGAGYAIGATTGPEEGRAERGLLYGAIGATGGPTLAKAGKRLLGSSQVFRGFAQTGKAELGEMGPAASRLNMAMDRVKTDAQFNAGGRATEFEELTKGFTPDEALNLRTSSEGFAQPMNDRVRAARDWWANYRAAVDQRAQSAGLEIHDTANPNRKIPWQPRANYWPRKYRWDEILGDNGRRQLVAQAMVDEGKAVDLADALTKMDSFLSSRVPRQGNLEYSRVIEGYMPELAPHRFDPIEEAVSYIREAEERLVYAEKFGPNDEAIHGWVRPDGVKVPGLMEKIRVENGGGAKGDLAVKLADDIFKMERGTAKDDALDVAADYATAFEVVTKMGLSSIANWTQKANYAVASDPILLLQKMMITMFGKGKADAELYARSIGAIGPEVMQTALTDMRRMTTPRRVASKFLSATGFSGVEAKNRILGAAIGPEWIIRNARALTKNPKNDAARRVLERLNLEPDEILRRHVAGEELLSPEEVAKGTLEFTNQAQFRVTPKEKPRYWNMGAGRVLTQFKSFAMAQGNFLRKHVYDEAVRGNWKPLIYFATISPLFGEVALDVKAALLGKDRTKNNDGTPKTLTDRYIEDMMAVGGFGLFTDLLSAAKYRGGVRSAAAGPTLETGYRFLEAGAEDMRKTGFPIGEKVGLEALRQVPAIGAPASHRFSDMLKKNRAKEKERESKPKKKTFANRYSRW